MAIDHIVLSLPATTKTALFTVPAKSTPCHVTIQNRDSVASMSIGDDTLGAVSGANAGILISNATTAATVTPSTFQLWMNPGDTIYGYASAIMTNSCVVLYSFANVTNPNYATPTF